MFVFGSARHPARAHGASGDARRTDNLEHLGAHAGSLIVRAGHEPMCGRVVAQELSVEVADDHGIELDKDTLAAVSPLVGSIPRLPSNIG